MTRYYQLYQHSLDVCSQSTATFSRTSLNNGIISFILLSNGTEGKAGCPGIWSWRLTSPLISISTAYRNVTSTLSTSIQGVPGGNVSDFRRMFLTLKYTALTQNTYIRNWELTEIMAREKCGLLAVPRTVSVSRVVTRTLRMSVLQSHSRVKHIPTSLSTDVTVTVNCNSILLAIHVPCKVSGTLRTTTTLERVYVV